LRLRIKFAAPPSRVPPPPLSGWSLWSLLSFFQMGRFYSGRWALHHRGTREFSHLCVCVRHICDTIGEKVSDAVSWMKNCMYMFFFPLFFFFLLYVLPGSVIVLLGSFALFADGRE
jgi:hypothetical protein